MEITINTAILRKNSTTPDQVFFLYLFLHKDWKSLKETFSYEQALEERNSLIGTTYVLSTDKEAKVKETIISNKNVRKLFGLKKEVIPFIEFYNKYPLKVGTRVLRTKGLDTVMGKKHEKKYLSKVKTLEQHNKAVKAVEVFVNKQRQSGKLQYLPNMLTVVNNAMWESWESLIEVKGMEGKDWNDEIV